MSDSSSDFHLQPPDFSQLAPPVKDPQLPPDITQTPGTTKQGVQAQSPANQGAQTTSGAQGGSSSITVPYSNVLFAATELLIGLSGVLNSYLAVFSKNILQNDLNDDQWYAMELGKLTFEQGTSSAVTAYNRNVQMEQQTMQAEMKAHQNIESMDIQTASSITSDEQQLSSLISQTLSLLSQIAQAIGAINK